MVSSTSILEHAVRRIIAPVWAVLVLAALTNSSGIAAGSGCGALAWDLWAARAQLTAGSLPLVKPGTAATVGKAFRLEMQPRQSAALPVLPSRLPEGEATVGWVEVAAPPPDRLQVVLDGEGWIDAAEGGAPLKSVAFTGAKDCAGARKAVVFALSGAPLTLQVVAPGSASEIRVVLLPAP